MQNTNVSIGAMPQFSSLRLIFSSGRHHTATATATATALKTNSNLSSSFSLFFNPKTQSLYRPITYYPIQPQLRRFIPFSSYSRKYSRGKNPTNSQSFNLRHRSSSTASGSDKIKGEKSGSAMESEEGPSAGVKKSAFEFNKRRAEGRDKDTSSKKNLQLKVRKLNPVNTVCYVQILGTGMDTQDTSPSVLLFFDKQRFIFNAGEGLQRYCTEHKIKLSKIDHIFLSRVCSETAGGIPGLLLTLAGMGDAGMSVNVWGPSDLKYLVDAMKSFIPNAAMVHSHSFGPASDSFAKDELSEPLVLIDDEVIKLSAVLSRPSPTAVTNEGSSTQKLQPEGTDSQLLRHSSPLRSGLAAEPTMKPGDLAVIYICELPEIQGKFDPSKAAALGLKPGPKFRELQLGNSVKSDRQKIMVHPSDVMGPSVPGPIVLLVDCPTFMHFRDVSSAPSLSAYYSDTSIDSSYSSKVVNCVIHLSPSHVTNTMDYQKWMSRFAGAQHIMAGHEMRNIEFPILQSSARIAARLNYLCPKFFPAPGFWSYQHQKHITPGLSPCGEGPLPELCETIPAENLLKFTLRPYAQLGLDRSNIPKRVSHSEIIDELVSEIPEIADASDQVSQLWLGDGKPRMEVSDELTGELLNEEKIDSPDCMEDITREDLEIVLLGTGSSQPSKYRNVTSILVNLFSKGSLLFDCGEGTLGQLKRRFGVKGADDVIRGLRCIWISHIHADHHTGLARILALRRELLKGLPHEPLIVVGPRQLKRFLDAYQRLEDLDMIFLDCRHTTESSLNEFDLVAKTAVNDDSVTDVTEDGKIDSTLFAKGRRMQSYFKLPSSSMENTILKTLGKVLREAGLEALISFPVVHCPQAFGVVLKSANRVNGAGTGIPGWKIVYSGDTRPCPELVKAADGATILIHEATFEDGMLEEAIAKNHCTTGEAVQVGDSAGAYRIILTHFSQRYPKIPVFDEAHSHNTCIAFDLMSVNLADLPLLPRVVPFVKLLFRDEMVPDEYDDMTVESVAIA